MKKISKISALILAAIMLLTFAACSAPNAEKTALEIYVEENRDTLIEGFKQGFTSSGLDCECEVSATGNTLNFTCNVIGLNDVPKDVAEQVAIVYEGQKEALASSFTSFADEIPMDEININICEEDGDEIVTLNIPIN